MLFIDCLKKEVKVSVLVIVSRMIDTWRFVANDQIQRIHGRVSDISTRKPLGSLMYYKFSGCKGKCPKMDLIWVGELVWFMCPEIMSVYLNNLDIHIHEPLVVQTYLYVPIANLYL